MKVSIILPIRNEERFISKTLQSIIDQKFKGELEIIISDGLSNDGTLDIIKLFQKKYTYIKLIKNNAKIVPVGFNKALNFATGDIIIRLDGHSILKTDFIKNSIKILNKKNVSCVGGPTKHFSNTFVGENISIAQCSYFGAGGASFRTGVSKGKYVNTLAFGAYKRAEFLKVGAYDEELIRNQDEELNYRIVKNGGKIWIDPSIKSVYYVRNSIIKLFSQYYYYGFYKVRVIQKIKSIFSLRHLIPAVFVLTLISFIVIGILQRIIMPTLFLGAVYLFANITFSIYESVKHGVKSLILLPIIYFIMHFSYGLGFLVGLVFFANKWRASSVMDNSFKKEKFYLQTNA
tara:strand:+ start:2671 stop:3708 length:1038 start_codon:yes stop_codon:yes gene_type:complete